MRRSPGPPFPLIVFEIHLKKINSFLLFNYFRFFLCATAVSLAMVAQHKTEGKCPDRIVVRVAHVRIKTKIPVFSLVPRAADAVKRTPYFWNGIP